MATDAVVDVVSRHIVRTPGVCGGAARVAGTRVRVSDIAIALQSQGLAVAEIAENFDVTLADVHAALAYYHDNPDAMRAEQDELDARVARHRADRPGVPLPADR